MLLMIACVRVIVRVEGKVRVIFGSYSVVSLERIPGCPASPHTL